jgi:hypothetical protein
VNSEAFGRETGEESIAQRSQRSQRGFKIGGERTAVNSEAFGRETDEESIVERSRRSQRGI